MTAEQIYNDHTMKRWWNQYKYRFVPWLAINIKERSVRRVLNDMTDKVIPDENVINKLHYFLWTLYHARPPLSSNELVKGIDINHYVTNNDKGLNSKETYVENIKLMRETLGFVVERSQSIIPGAGTGVIVKEGILKKGSIAALYPGCLYYPSEPIFFQSIGNQFIFKCVDGVLIDGNDRGISKFIFRSCSNRDQLGPLPLSDNTWLTDFTRNPLSIGQYVNNHNKDNPANVVYQEVSLPPNFPIVLKQYLPNVFYQGPQNLDSTPHSHQRLVKLVALIALRNINAGEELYSSYLTIIN